MPHAPGHLRDAFCGWVADGMPDEVPAEDEERPYPVGGCSASCGTAPLDTMPSYLCDDLDMPRGSTYASAVQVLTH
jgi:hypothetical protein